MLQPGDEIACVTDATSYPGRVLIGVSRPSISYVLTVAASEYDGVILAGALGFPQMEVKKRGK